MNSMKVCYYVLLFFGSHTTTNILEIETPYFDAALYVFRFAYEIYNG